VQINRKYGTLTTIISRLPLDGKFLGYGLLIYRSSSFSFVSVSLSARI